MEVVEAGGRWCLPWSTGGTAAASLLALATTTLVQGSVDVSDPLGFLSLHLLPWLAAHPFVTG